MKWLGTVKDQKDLTTKEYVDNADTVLKEATEKSLAALDKAKVNSEDITEYSQEEVALLWAKHFTS